MQFWVLCLTTLSDTDFYEELCTDPNSEYKQTIDDKNITYQENSKREAVGDQLIHYRTLDKSWINAISFIYFCFSSIIHYRKLHNLYNFLSEIASLAFPISISSQSNISSYHCVHGYHLLRISSTHRAFNKCPNGYPIIMILRKNINSSDLESDQRKTYW